LSIVIIAAITDRRIRDERPRRSIVRNNYRTQNTALRNAERTRKLRRKKVALNRERKINCFSQIRWVANEMTMLEKRKRTRVELNHRKYRQT
jgi:hypothetical protein